MPKPVDPTKRKVFDVKAIERAVEDEVRDIAAEAQPVAHGLAPRRTGRLKASVKTFERQDETQFSAGVQAHMLPGLFAEYGTKRQAKRPFLEPAFPSNDEIVNRISDAFINAIKKQT